MLKDYTRLLIHVDRTAVREGGSHLSETKSLYPNNHWIYVYRFIQGISTVLTICAAASPYLLMISLALSVSMILIACLLTGLLFIYLSKVQEKYNTNTLRFLHLNLVQKKSKIKQHVARINVLLKQFNPQDNLSKLTMTNRSTNLLSQPPSLIHVLKTLAVEEGKTPYYQDPNSWFYHVYRGAYVFFFSTGITLGVLLFLSGVFMAFHTFPLWISYTIAILVGIAAVAGEYVHEVNYRKQLALLHIEFYSAKNIEQALEDYHQELYERCHESARATQKADSKVETLPPSTGSSLANLTAAGLFGTIKHNNQDSMKNYFLWKKLKKIRTACREYCYRLDDEHWDQPQPLLKRKNIHTAQAIILLIERVYSHKDYYTAAVHQIKNLISQARNYSCMQIKHLYPGNSLLADLVEPIVESIFRAPYDLTTNCHLPLDDINIKTPPSPSNHSHETDFLLQEKELAVFGRSSKTI